MAELWKILLEVTIEITDSSSGRTNGFMNVVTWADSLTEARTKIENYFVRSNWHVIEVAEAVVLGRDYVCDDNEFHELVERARQNPNAIMYGTFHSYPAN